MKTTYTVTRYTSIGECPLVILINNSVKSGITVNSLDELRTILNEKGQLVYFVADKDDNRISGLDNWNDNIFPYNHDDVVNRIANYVNNSNNN